MNKIIFSCTISLIASVSLVFTMDDPNVLTSLVFKAAYRNPRGNDPEYITHCFTKDKDSEDRFFDDVSESDRKYTIKVCLLKDKHGENKNSGCNIWNPSLHRRKEPDEVKILLYFLFCYGQNYTAQQRVSVTRSEEEHFTQFFLPRLTQEILESKNDDIYFSVTFTDVYKGKVSGDFSIAKTKLATNFGIVLPDKIQKDDSTIQVTEPPKDCALSSRDTILKYLPVILVMGSSFALLMIAIFKMKTK